MLNELIKKYRQDNDLTQQELANKLFVTRSAVAKWEQGRGFPSEDILEKLSQLINVPTEQLLSEKELRSLTVENTNIVKKHKNFLYFIIPLIVLLIISVSVLFLISLAPKEQAPQPIIYTKDAYNVAKVENNTLTFNVEHDVEVNIELTDENNKNIKCISKHGNIFHIKDIKDGYRLKANYSYNSQTNSYTVNSIKVIDDYVENEYYIYGFFIAIEEYVGDCAPVYNSNDPNYYYELNGVLHPISDRYPFAEISYNSMRCAGIKHHSSYLTTAGIKEYNFSLSVYKDVEKIFVYALDNSEKGFNLHTAPTLIGSQTEVVLKECAIFNESFKNHNSEYPYKTDCNIKIVINKISTPSLLKISEYDSEHNLIKTTFYTTYEEVSYKSYKLQHSTNYIEVVQNLNVCGIFTKDFSLYTTLKNKHGFMLNTYLFIS